MSGEQNAGPRPQEGDDVIDTGPEWSAPRWLRRLEPWQHRVPNGVRWVLAAVVLAGLTFTVARPAPHHADPPAPTTSSTSPGRVPQSHYPGLLREYHDNADQTSAGSTSPSGASTRTDASASPRVGP